ncbi:hypothetical protein AAE478_004701 [Parahypoxylon ruwenzoriense]
MRVHRYLTTLALSIHASILLSYAQSLPDPIICEDTLDGRPPFESRHVPCLLGCGVPVAVATGGLLPGSVNGTDIPYCQLDCVHEDATPSQSAAAPDCYRRCGVRNQATPENIGWCMYWCVDGFADLVESTACVPSLEFGTLPVTTVGGVTLTLRPFTHPSEWESWYLTQTVLPKSGSSGDVITSPPSTAVSSSSVQASTISVGDITPAQATQSSGLSVDVEPVSTTTAGEQSVPSPTTAGGVDHLLPRIWLQILSFISVSIIVA